MKKIYNVELHVSSELAKLATLGDINQFGNEDEKLNVSTSSQKKWHFIILPLLFFEEQWFQKNFLKLFEDFVYLDAIILLVDEFIEHEIRFITKDNSA